MREREKDRVGEREECLRPPSVPKNRNHGTAQTLISGKTHSTAEKTCHAGQNTKQSPSSVDNVCHLVKERVVGALPGAGLLDGAAAYHLHDGVQLTSQQFPGLQHVDTDLHRHRQPDVSVWIVNGDTGDTYIY